MELDRWKLPDGILSGLLGEIDSFLAGRDDRARAREAEAQVNLLQQLHDLYAEIEEAGGRRPRDLVTENARLAAEANTLRQQTAGVEAAILAGLGPAEVNLEPSLVEQLNSLYAEIEQAGGRGPAELSEVCDQLTHQLQDLYQEIEEADGQRPAELTLLVESLLEQLHAVYGEREDEIERTGEDSELVQSLVEQLHELYAEKEDDPRDEMIESLDAQLRELYEERERVNGFEERLGHVVARLEELYTERELVGAVPNSQPSEDDVDIEGKAYEIIESLVAQLECLYSEKESSPPFEEMIESLTEQLQDFYAEREEGSDPDNVIKSLEAQVRSFTEEKMELRSQVESLTRQLQSVRQRARYITKALTETALSD